MFENIKYFKIIFYIFKYLLKITFIYSTLFLIILNICHYKIIENNQKMFSKNILFFVFKNKKYSFIFLVLRTEKYF